MDNGKIGLHESDDIFNDIELELAPVDMNLEESDFLQEANLLKSDTEILTQFSQNLLNSPLGITDTAKIIKSLKLKPLTSSNIYTQNKFDENGLFSEEIFGHIGTTKRKFQLAYIDLSAIGPFLQPNVIYILRRYGKSIYDSICGTTNKPKLFVFDSKTGMLQSLDEGKEKRPTDNSNVTVLYGKKLAFFLVHNVEKIENLSPTIKTSLTNAGLLALTNYILVLPPDLRPIIKTEHFDNIDAINDTYKSILHLSQTAHSVSDPDNSMSDIVWATIQRRICELFDAISSVLMKKTGIIRSSLLSKRQDFNIRAVITPDPTLEPQEIGLPYRSAASLAFYFIIYEFQHGVCHYFNKPYTELLEKHGYKSIIDFEQLLKDFERGIILTGSELEKIVQSAIERVFYHRKRMVLIKRDPALHRDSWAVAKVKLHMGNSIHFPPSAVEPLNADFDGDSISGDTVIKLYDKNSTIVWDGKVQDLIPSFG